MFVYNIMFISSNQEGSVSSDESDKSDESDTSSESDEESEEISEYEKAIEQNRRRNKRILDQIMVHLYH